ncbi:MAG: cytoplasmic protein [Desulfobacteraceae bacterium]|nr:cytoplasmic protein [Desulfobacteraceae bacterium]
MSKHTHQFVETYQGLIGFGLDRETDENTVICYLQKFSDDALMETLRNRLTDAELEDIFSLLSNLLCRHLSEKEYHDLFLGDESEAAENE